MSSASLRTRLAAGDDQRIDVVELLRLAHIDRVGAEPLEGVEVLAKIALEAEDACAS
jgi:hypothetical protein